MVWITSLLLDFNHKNKNTSQENQYLLYAKAIIIWDEKLYLCPRPEVSKLFPAKGQTAKFWAFWATQSLSQTQLCYYCAKVAMNNTFKIRRLCFNKAVFIKKQKTGSGYSCCGSVG